VRFFLASRAKKTGIKACRDASWFALIIRSHSRSLCGRGSGAFKALSCGSIGMTLSVSEPSSTSLLPTLSGPDLGSTGKTSSKSKFCSSSLSSAYCAIEIGLMGIGLMGIGLGRWAAKRSLFFCRCRCSVRCLERAFFRLSCCTFL